MTNKIETTITALDIPEKDALRLARFLRGEMVAGSLEEREGNYQFCQMWAQAFELYARQKTLGALLTPAIEAEFIACLAQA